MIKYNKDFMVLWVDNKKIEFTPIEFKIFNLLIKKHPLYATFEEINKTIYKMSYDKSFRNAINVHVSGLRKKLKGVFVITNKKELGMSINFDRGYLENFS